VRASHARWLLFGIVLTFAAIAATVTSAVPGSAPANPWMETPTTAELREKALRFKRSARHWRALMGDPRPVLAPREVPFPSLLAKRSWLVRRWHAKATRAHRLFKRPPHRTQWLCIHRHEGAWRDPDAPYFGGLQMDLTFQRTYGRRLLRREGTADRWSPLEQMWVAEGALRAGRGFYPWPVSARNCGLI
jgi:hypothetical protein